MEQHETDMFCPVYLLFYVLNGVELLFFNGLNDVILNVFWFLFEELLVTLVVR